MTAVKRCPRCGQVKPADQFYRRRTRLSSFCRSCQRAAAQAAHNRRRQPLTPAAWTGRPAIQARQTGRPAGSP